MEDGYEQNSSLLVSDICIVIMAGGLGKRMESDTPKVLHLITNKPMIVRVIENAKRLNPIKILIVVGQYENIIKQTLSKFIDINDVQFISQNVALGTGHAIQCCRDELMKYEDTKTLILSGDVPLLTSETMSMICKNININGCNLLCTYIDNPQGYGRIKMINDKFCRIIEEKDCSEYERKITLINGGVYVFRTDVLCNNIMLLNNQNASNEYYLTDILEIIQKKYTDTINICILPQEKSLELVGINTKEQLQTLNNTLIATCYSK